MEIKSKNIFIPKGSNKAIISYLNNKEGLSVYLIDAYILQKLGGAKSGYVRLSSKHLTKLKFLKELVNPKLLMVNLVLIPGETTHIFLQNIAKELNLSFELLMAEYTKLAPYPDGVIFPDTYRVSTNLKEKGVIGYLLNFSMKKHKKLAKKYYGEYNQKLWFKKITVASIIQKESASVEEMPLISSVIYNRIKKGMKLQMDGTLNYGKYSHIKITPKRIKEDTSHFNTYKFKGIPKSPVSSVQKEAIDAAINPKKSKYLYFVRGKDGNHLFSTSYKKHLRYIKNGKK